MKILLLDLDGTIRQCKSNPNGFINSPEDQEPIRAAQKAIARYDSPEWKLFGVTNQGGVAAGFKTLEGAIAEQKVTLSLFPLLDSILMCPDSGELCVHVHRGWTQNIERGSLPSFRKSAETDGSGMLHLALSLVEERAEEVLMVGDRPEDEASAWYAGIPFQWAKDWWEE